MHTSARSRSRCETDPLRQLEFILAALLQRQGFSGGSLAEQELALQEVVARDGGLPLFLAQAAVWADIAGMPQVQDACEIVPDDRALVRARVVWTLSQEAPPQARLGAPLLLFVNQVVHVMRDATRSERVPLEALIDPPTPGVFDALSLRGWPTLHAARLGQ